MEHNNLTMISETNFNNTLPNINIITMNSNSWICDCDAKNTINFIHKYSSKVKHEALNNYELLYLLLIYIFFFFNRFLI